MPSFIKRGVFFLNDLEEEQGQLGGPGWVIELDESSFRKKSKYGKGKNHGQNWVLGISERDPSGEGNGRGRFFAVPNRNRVTLLSIILKHVKPGTTIMTDAWGAYTTLGSHGFKHQIVNHTVGFVDPDIPSVCS